VPGDPEECREHAKRCLELAANAKTAVDKASFEMLADKWEDLAIELETSNRPG
jgi:hypothetical protein